jgi:hypothetical protein
VKFWLGLGIGLALGGGAMYLALHAGGSAMAPSVDPVATTAPIDAGAPGKKKPRRHGGGGGAAGSTAGGDPVDLGDEPAPALTDADRRSVTQGDDVSAGPRTLDMSSSDDARPLSSGEIAQGLASASGALEGCISSAVAGAELHAAISLGLLVDGAGRVTKVRVQAPHWLFDHGLYGCMRTAATRLRFAATGAPTTVTAPFSLD